MFTKDHVHPLTVSTNKKCPLWLSRVTPTDPQNLLDANKDKSSLTALCIFKVPVDDDLPALGDR